MKGVLICGGSGSRLKPLTDITNKSLLPVYDKPLIHYPLSVLTRAGIKDIIVITGSERIDQMASYLGSGMRFGCTFSYRVQEVAGGIAQALGLAEDFADGESVCAILGDNVYFDDLSETIHNFTSGGHIFVKEVDDPKRFGIVEVDGDRILSIEEKPTAPRSNFAQTGCYIYDAQCFDVIHSLKPSDRNELEITDVTKWYHKQNALNFTVLKDEWVDAGTFESLYRASELVRERQSSSQSAKNH